MKINHTKKKKNPSAQRSMLKIFSLVIAIILGGLITYFIYYNINKPFSLNPTGLKQKDVKINFEDFSGSESCKECHLKEYDLWKTSTHAKAGGEPENVHIIAKFDGKPLRFKDAVVFPKLTDDGKYIFEVVRDEHPSFTISVDAVVGGGHMYGGGTQSFFTKFPDGTMRFLPFDFIRNENIWFVQLRKNAHWVPINDKLSLDDLMQWIPNRFLGNIQGTSNCQNCHGSQILIEENKTDKMYKTRYKTLHINCESCHGPAKRHIELANTKGYDGEDYAIDILATFSKDKSLSICFQCHAVKDVLKEGYLPGDDLEKYYALKLPILGKDVYLPDGRVNYFAYQQNHLFSDCYVNGSMTCVDCHDPHSQGYRDIYGKELTSRFDNGQCTGCHASKAIEPQMHSKHKKDSLGNLCTGCHMPYLQHRELGNELVFSRSDHVIPIPRPTFDSTIGIENACFKCHQDKSIAALQDVVNKWYGKIKPHNPMITDIIKAQKVTDISEASKLLLQPESNINISKFTGLVTFAKRFLKPDMNQLNKSVIENLILLSKSDDIDIKAMALMSLHLSSGRSPHINEFLFNSLAHMKQIEEDVRLRWTLGLDYFGNSYMTQKDYKTAITIYNKALEISPEDIFILNNTGIAYWRLNDFYKAIDCFSRIVEIDPYRTETYFDLAKLYNLSGLKTMAIESVNKILLNDTTNVRAQHLLKELQKK